MSRVCPCLPGRQRWTGLTGKSPGLPRSIPVPAWRTGSSRHRTLPPVPGIRRADPGGVKENRPIACPAGGIRVPMRYRGDLACLVYLLFLFVLNVAVAAGCRPSPVCSGIRVRSAYGATCGPETLPGLTIVHPRHPASARTVMGTVSWEMRSIPSSQQGQPCPTYIACGGFKGGGRPPCWHTFTVRFSTLTPINPAHRISPVVSGSPMSIFRSNTLPGAANPTRR